MSPEDLISVSMQSIDGHGFMFDDGSYKIVYTAEQVADAIEAAMDAERNFWHITDKSSAEYIKKADVAGARLLVNSSVKADRDYTAWRAKIKELRRK